jgi:hypothetical protein
MFEYFLNQEIDNNIKMELDFQEFLKQKVDWEIFLRNNMT